MDSTISYYTSIRITRGGDATTVYSFYNDIKEGRWQDHVLPIRAIKDKAARTKAKENAPATVLSGFCNERTDKGLVRHSGRIGMDIDDVNPEEVKDLTKGDPFIEAVFASISGTGACIVFLINGDKHVEAYEAIAGYLLDKYKLIADIKCKNPSRARFVSFDPHIYINLKAKKFTDIAKKKPEKKVQDVVYVQSDFEHVIKEIVSKEIDITPDYGTWLRVGLALADKFAESGRAIFHKLSQFNATYEASICDRQYDKCLNAKGAGLEKPVTIATIYHYAKEKGIQTVSDRTKLIVEAAYYAKKGGRDIESSVKYLLEAEGIPAEESRPVVEQVFQKNISIQTDETDIEQVHRFLQREFTILRNEITRKVEVDDREMDDIVFNNIYCRAKIVFGKMINAELLQRILNSDLIPTYNPLKDFFNQHKDIKPIGVIATFCSAIKSDNGLREGDFFPQFVEYFLKKWWVGVVASIYGSHSPLMLVLTGRQGNGKTEFFRRLLPESLKHFYAESKLDNDKDDAILLTKKLLICDDEMGGKSKKEEQHLKAILSKQIITVREPYGRYSVDLKRLAVLCGSTNDQEILNDPTGNRRIIPINVESIDYDLINSVDRTELLMEAYWLWKSGFKWELTGDDIKILNENTRHFEQPSIELELLTKFFHVADESDGEFITPAEIKSRIEMRTGQKLNITKIGKELKKMGGVKKPKKVSGTVVYGYILVDKDRVVDSGRQGVDSKNNFPYQPARY